MPADYPDALPHGPVRGRGAGLNPGNRFEPGATGDGIRLHILGEHLDEAADERPGGRQVATRVLDDETRSIINRVDSPDLPFRWTVNPYRGCEHGCVYCYARPTHETLGLSCGLDFETTIIAKPKAPELLRAALAKPSWTPEPIAMSGVTDPYQPQERRLEITRRCLAVCADARQPVAIVTKNRLVVRDLDHLAELAAHGATRVALSVTTLDRELARTLEPRASSPEARLDAIRTLAAARIPVIAMVAPIIPGLTDHEIPRILEAVADAGGHGATWVMLRLPFQVKALFTDWLRRTVPDRADRVLHAVESVRGGRLNSAQFGERMRGTGRRADHIANTFDVFAKRYGLKRTLPPLRTDAFRRPESHGQMRLFGP